MIEQREPIVEPQGNAAKMLSLVRSHVRRGESGAVAYPAMGQERRAESAEHADGSLASMVDRRWAEIGAIIVSAAMLVYILHLYTRFALPPGTDSGQWLTVSRFYLFEHVPEGRSISTVPPVVPVSLAALSLVTGTTGAIVAMAAVCYAAFCFVAFRLGQRLCGDGAGGLLAVVAIAIVQSQLFEFFAMGAFPQLGALLGMAVVLYALLALVERPDDRREWLTLAGGVALTLFSHTPSSTVLLPVLAVCLGYVMWSSDDRRGVARNAAMTLGPVFALWLVFLFINRSVIFGYANVPAAYDLKGPDKLFDVIWRNNAQRIVFGAGLITLMSLPWLATNDGGWRSARRFRGRPMVLLSAWTAALLGIVTLTAMRHTGTDYPRFIAYFIVPLGLAVAAGIHSFRLSRPTAVGILVPVLLFAGQDGMEHFDTATRFYGMNNRADDLAGVSSWLNNKAGDGGVIGGTRETKWIEALTGRNSLLYMPRIYITRKFEVERALQAEVVLRSNGGIETGRMLITANDGGQDFGKVFPAGVRFDVFQKGVYTHAFTLRDTTAAITFATFGTTQKRSLAKMTNTGTRAWHDDTGEHLATTFTLADQPVSIVRVVSASGMDLDVATVDYYVGAPDGVLPDSLIIGTGDSGTIEIKPGATSLLYPRLADGSFIELEGKTSWLGGAVPPQDANGFLTWRRASIHFDIGGGEQRVPYAQLFDPAAMLKEDGIRYIVDRNGDGASFPIIRQFGLEPAYENEEYKVYELPNR